MAGLFTNFSAPSIDGQAVRRQLSSVLMENIVQGLHQKNERGVTEKFSDDPEATEIRVVRENPLTQSARQIGSQLAGAVNTGFFNSGSAEQPTSSEYGVRVINVIDQNIDIPANMQLMFKREIIDKTVKNLRQLVDRNINASTIAEQVAKNLNYEFDTYGANGGAGETRVVYTAATDSALDKLMDCARLLDKGDVANGVDTFDYSGRIALWNADFKAELLSTAKSVFEIGNWKAQDMLKVGAVDPETVPNNIDDGFFGFIDQAPQIFVSPSVFAEAEKYLGLAAGGLDGVYGLMAHAIGTLRAIAFTSEMKMIDSPLGQGVRIQPKYRWGHETIFPKSVVLLTSDTWVSPVIDIASKLDVVPTGSRP